MPINWHELGYVSVIKFANMFLNESICVRVEFEFLEHPTKTSVIASWLHYVVAMSVWGKRTKHRRIFAKS